MNEKELMDKIKMDRIKRDAMYYLLNLTDNSAIAILENIDNNWQSGYRFCREWDKENGYHWKIEATRIDAGFCISALCDSNYDITKDFERAKEVALKHTK